MKWWEENYSPYHYGIISLSLVVNANYEKGIMGTVYIVVTPLDSGIQIDNEQKLPASQDFSF